MINGKYHSQFIVDDEIVVVDIAKINGEYEVIALDETSEELDSFKTDDFDMAVRVYERMCERCGAPPLKGKYAKLRKDVEAAKTAAEVELTMNPEDGGTCNFDSPVIYLPKWNEKLVMQAFDEAGLGCWVHNFFGKCFVISVHGGQGNGRTRYAEAVERSLKEAGYKTSMYYAMD